MRLAQVGFAGSERPAVVDGSGRRWDLSSVVADIDGAFLSGDSVAFARQALAAGGLPEVDPAERWGAPVARPGTVVCIGLNYSDHASETGMAAPSEPIIFLKATNTVVGPNDTVLIPRGSVKTDYEVELAVVIGRTARYLAARPMRRRHRRLRDRQRRLRARVPTRARRAVGQGQVV